MRLRIGGRVKVLGPEDASPVLLRSDGAVLCNLSECDHRKDQRRTLRPWDLPRFPEALLAQGYPVSRSRVGGAQHSCGLAPDHLRKGPQALSPRVFSGEGGGDTGREIPDSLFKKQNERLNMMRNVIVQNLVFQMLNPPRVLGGGRVWSAAVRGARGAW